MRSVYLLGLLGVSGVALAADVDPYAPSGSMAHGAGSPTTESPLLSNAGFSAGLAATLARNLATYDYADGRSQVLAREAFSTALYGGWTFEDRARIEIIAPIYLHGRTGTTIDSFSGPAMGDVLLQGNIRLFQNEPGSFAVSVVPTFGVPTGPRNALLGRGPHGRLRGAIGGEVQERFGYSANLGFTLSPGVGFEDVAYGSTLEGAAGAYVYLDRNLRVGADYEHRIGVSNAPGARNDIAWAHLFAQVMNDDGLGLAVAAGSGVVQGVGAPQWRIQAALTFARQTRDTDGDGLDDRVDACPLDPEDLDGFEDLDGCPDLDNDGDTILDTDDACPDEPEDFDGFDDLDGCPDLDNDADGILDADDACPIVPGIPEMQGCPDTDGDGLTDALDQCPLDPGPGELFGCPDRDQDQIPDFRDACPDTPRSADEPAEFSNGCPTKAFVQGDRITITEKVLFETGKATIRPESFGLLDDVVAAMQGTPQIRLVEVAGHTDNVGSPRFNKGLSDRRAASVRDYLLGKGIERERLSSKGYGLDEPIDTNMTELGRERNRRVEFRILQQDPITEQVEVRLGQDLGGISVRMPTERPFTRVEVDGQVVSPRAPFRGLIVKPGTRTVRVVDEARGLDLTSTVEVGGGQTVVVPVPESAIARPDVVKPAGPVPDGSPMALPIPFDGAAPQGAEPAPTEPEPAPAAPEPRTRTAPSAPVEPVAPAPVEPAAPEPRTRTAPSAPVEPAEPVPAPAAPAPAAPAPAEPLFRPDEGGLDEPAFRPRLFSPTTEPAAAPVDDPAPAPAAPAAEPVAPAPAVDDAAPAEVSGPGFGEPSGDTVGGPGFGEPSGDTVGGPGFGQPSGDTVGGPGFGDADPASIAGPGFGQALSPKEQRRAEKEAEKARKQAEKEARRAAGEAAPVDDAAPESPATDD